MKKVIGKTITWADLATLINKMPDKDRNSRINVVDNGGCDVFVNALKKTNIGIYLYEDDKIREDEYKKSRKVIIW